MLYSISRCQIYSWKIYIASKEKHVLRCDGMFLFRRAIWRMWAYSILLASLATATNRQKKNKTFSRMYYLSWTINYSTFSQCEFSLLQLSALPPPLYTLIIIFSHLFASKFYKPALFLNMFNSVLNYINSFQWIAINAQSLNWFCIFCYQFQIIVQVETFLTKLTILFVINILLMGYLFYLE